MAGVKGKSGGKRAGAGRKPAQTRVPAKDTASKAAGDVPGSPIDDGKVREPLEFLELVMNDPTAPLKDRIRAGVAAAQYRHTKRGDGGKKDEAADKAKKAGAGKFKPAPAPLKLVQR